jgi:signal transduction histidine kinase
MIRHAMAEVPGSLGAGEMDHDDSPSLRHICHELRQPLVVAIGYISMLEDGSFGELPAEARTILDTVAERLDAMNAIIDRLAGMAEQASVSGPTSGLDG